MYMRHVRILIVLVLFMSLAAQFVCGQATVTFTNPIVPSGGIAGAADPWVLFEGGFYYYCRTLHDSGIGVAKARRLQDIGLVPMKRVWVPPAGSACSKQIWAPELHHLDGKWYIYFAADDGQNRNHRMYVLQGDSPQGEFRLLGKICDPSDRWAIDGTVLTWQGKRYFIWSGWEGDSNTKQLIYIAPMGNPWTVSGPRVELSRPELPWEIIGNPKINEGPEVLIRNGTIHIIYSASGSWTEDYCIGQLTFTGGDMLSKKSWKKKGTPVFTKVPTSYGPGHCSFTKSPDGKEDWIVYHAYQKPNMGWSNRSVRAQKFSWNADNSPNFEMPVPFGARIAEPSGTPPRE